MDDDSIFDEEAPKPLTDVQNDAKANGGKPSKEISASDMYDEVSRVVPFPTALEYNSF